MEENRLEIIDETSRVVVERVKSEMKRKANAIEAVVLQESYISALKSNFEEKLKEAEATLDKGLRVNRDAHESEIRRLYDEYWALPAVKAEMNRRRMQKGGKKS